MTTNPVHAIKYQGIEPLQREQLLKETKSKPGATIIKEPNLLRIEVPDEASVLIFTEKGHPAHPSVIIRKVVKNGEKISIETQGYTAGERIVFENWLKQFETQDALIMKDLSDK